jgi:hypothetical protein
MMVRTELSYVTGDVIKFLLRLTITVKNKSEKSAVTFRQSQVAYITNSGSSLADKLR